MEGPSTSRARHIGAAPDELASLPSRSPRSTLFSGGKMPLSPGTFSLRTLKPVKSSQSPADEPSSWPNAQQDLDLGSRPVTPASEIDLTQADNFLGPAALDSPSAPPPSPSMRPNRLLPRDVLDHLPPADLTPRPKVGSGLQTALTLTSKSSSTPHMTPRLRKVKHAFRALRRPRSRAGSSSSSSSDETGSSSTGIRWRFWQSSTSSSGDEPPEERGPAFTLVLPNLAFPLASNLPYERSETLSMNEALDELQKYWSHKAQTEDFNGDLGDGPSSAQRFVLGKFGKRRVTKADADQAGWWLDVQCPSVRDMRMMRKLIPMHPLTIEDVLQRDQREKMEAYEGLGYHFVVFKALHEPDNGSGDRRSKSDPAATLQMNDRDEGVGYQGVEVYLLIYDDGIVTFHFDPIDKHFSRVYEKLQQYGVTRPINSQWIAYGLMDSVTDAFFPLLHYLEAKTAQVEELLLDPSIAVQPKKVKRPLPAAAEKIAFELWKRFFQLLNPRFFPGPPPIIADHGRILKDVAELRKSITGLLRLLGPKVDLVRGLRKRIMEIRRHQEHDAENRERDVTVYFGDLLDHILSMSQSLNFLDSSLSHDHPVFNGIVKVALERTKQRADEVVLRLSAVALVFGPLASISGLFGVNIYFTMNTQFPTWTAPLPPFHWFGAIISMVVAFALLIITAITLISQTSRRKFERKRDLLKAI